MFLRWVKTIAGETHRINDCVSSVSSYGVCVAFMSELTPTFEMMLTALPSPCTTRASSQ